jgi:FRG domain
MPAESECSPRAFLCQSQRVPFRTVTVNSWNEIHGHVKDNWLYRGHRHFHWNLETSLERYCKRQNVASNDIPRLERLIIREFKRAYHEFGAQSPANDAHMEWLALMQHHGAPTRILDFTYSLYVAAYFALEDASGDAAVWAINPLWAADQSSAAALAARKAGADRIGRRWHSTQDEAVFESLFMSPPYVRMVCPLNPFLLNDRLRSQLGAFLVPGDVTSSFASNLESLPDHDREENVYCLQLPAEMKREALRQLFLMNVTRGSLFPGLDGYAQMLGIYHPVLANPHQWDDD